MSQISPISTSGEAAAEVVTTRLLAYPREAVFAAFSDPAKLAGWWGPEGFTNTFELFDFQPGGEWTFVMHGPDGRNYPNHSRFAEIVAPEKVVFDHLDQGFEFRMVMTFEDLGGSTRLTWRMSLSPRMREMRDFIVQANEQNFDRLEGCLKGGA